jgi:hypothetical protein
MNVAHMWIIFWVAVIGMGCVFGSFWKGFVYTVWTGATLLFWWGAVVIIHSLLS